MSADNGVYTLITAAAGGGKEYRVAYAHAIENIFTEDVCMDAGTEYCNCRDALVWSPDVKLNAAYVVEYFGDSRVYTTPEEAATYAQALEDEHTYECEDGKFGTEYGMVTFDHSAVPFPGKLQLVSSA